MIALIRISTLILMILIISVFLARGLGYVGSPMSQGYVELKTQLYDDGNIMCWNGICPGQSISDAVEKFSAYQPFLVSTKYGLIFDYSEYMRVNVLNNMGNDDLVDEINLEINPNYLTLGDLFMLVGNPRWVSGRSYVQIAVVWQKEICFSRGIFASIRGVTHRIEANLSVIRLVIIDPARDSYCSSDEYVPWQGFGQRPFIE